MDKDKLQKTNLKDEKKRIFLREDGILSVEFKRLENETPEDIINNLYKDFKEIMAEHSLGKVRIIITGGLPSISYYPISLRKKSINLLKEVLPLCEKVAMWGGGSVPRAVTKFIFGAINSKKIKLFDTKEEALKWLKED